MNGNLLQSNQALCSGTKADKGGTSAWIISADSDLRKKIVRLVRQTRCEVVEMIIPPEDCLSWIRTAEGPCMIILDIGCDMDWGMQAIQEIRKRRIQAPLVVLTESFSKDFGAKIISQGVHYYFSRDFLEKEFLDVVKNLLLSRVNEINGSVRSDGR